MRKSADSLEEIPLKQLIFTGRCSKKYIYMVCSLLNLHIKNYYYHHHRSTLQMGKLRPREAKAFPRIQLLCTWWSQDLSPGHRTPESELFITNYTQGHPAMPWVQMVFERVCLFPGPRSSCTIPLCGLAMLPSKDQNRQALDSSTS